MTVDQSFANLKTKELDTSKIQKNHETRSISSKEINTFGPDSYHELPQADYFQCYESVFKNNSKHKIRIADLPDAIRTWKIKTDQGDKVDISRRYQYQKSKNTLSEPEIKRLLPTITTNGVFIPERNKENLSELTGYIFIDYDHLKDPVKQRALAAKKIGRYCLSIHISFSGSGLHVLIRVDLKNEAEIDLYQEAVSKILRLSRSRDQACKDITRLMIIPHDPEAVTTLFPEVFKLPEQIKSRKVNGSDNSIVSQLEVPGIPPRVDAIIKYVDEHDLWGKARMQQNKIYGSFSKLLGEFTYPEMEAFLKIDEFRLKLFHPDSITGKNRGKVLSQLKRIHTKIQEDKGRKAEPFRKVYKDVLFSDSLTWKAKYVYAGLTMFMKYEDPLAEFWPSQETLAKILRISESIVMRGINELINAKFIIRERSKGRCNSYRINGEKTPPYGEVLESVLFSDSLSWKAKYIYAGLTIYANKKGECRPSHNDLAEKLNVSMDTIRRGIRELIEAEIISREIREGKSNFYQLINKLTTVPQHPPQC